jgi:hypothetical protein
LYAAAGKAGHELGAGRRFAVKPGISGDVTGAGELRASLTVPLRRPASAQRAAETARGPRAATWRRDMSLLARGSSRATWATQPKVPIAQARDHLDLRQVSSESTGWRCSSLSLLVRIKDQRWKIIGSESADRHESAPIAAEEPATMYTMKSAGISCNTEPGPRASAIRASR